MRFAPYGNALLLSLKSITQVVKKVLRGAGGGGQEGRGSSSEAGFPAGTRGQPPHGPCSCQEAAAGARQGQLYLCVKVSVLYSPSGPAGPAGKLAVQPMLALSIRSIAFKHSVLFMVGLNIPQKVSATT